jgi:DNA-binding XRE family transcriptional regulator
MLLSIILKYFITSSGIVKRILSYRTFIVKEHYFKTNTEENLYQSDVAKVIGTTEETICNWENNHTSPKVMFFLKFKIWIESGALSM